MKVEHNIERLKYLLELYDLTVEDFSQKISAGLKKNLTEEDLFSKEIKLGTLKRIDKLFNRGLHFYLDPKSLEKNKEASVFFRKKEFNSQLNIGARKVVNEFEEFKISLSAIAKLADLDLQRVFKVYSVKNNPQHVAKEVSKMLYPDFKSSLKDFLTELIGKFAEYNILVFEFVETWNKKDKANIDGFFLNPNVIVLKRQQSAFRREIFTLIHELGHFLLNEEDIDKLEYQQMSKSNPSAVERWCNDFAYYFLIHDYSEQINAITKADSSNDYHHEVIEHISKKTHLSQFALYTRLYYEDKLTKRNYIKIKTDFDERYRIKVEEEKRLKELERIKGKKQMGAVPQPIKSPLLISTIQTAFYEGVLNEFEACQKLKIKPEKLEKYLS